MIKWFLKWFRGKPVPKYLSGKEETTSTLIIGHLGKEETTSRLIIGHLMDVNPSINNKS